MGHDLIDCGTSCTSRGMYMIVKQHQQSWPVGYRLPRLFSIHLPCKTHRSPGWNLLEPAGTSGNLDNLDNLWASFADEQGCEDAK